MKYLSEGSRAVLPRNLSGFTITLSCIHSKTTFQQLSFETSLAFQCKTVVQSSAKIGRFISIRVSFHVGSIFRVRQLCLKFLKQFTAYYLRSHFYVIPLKCQNRREACIYGIPDLNYIVRLKEMGTGMRWDKSRKENT